VEIWNFSFEIPYHKNIYSVVHLEKHFVTESCICIVTTVIGDHEVLCSELSLSPISQLGTATWAALLVCLLYQHHC
jgi:hypothetical protein